MTGIKRTAGGCSPRSSGAATHRWLVVATLLAGAPAAAQLGSPASWTTPRTPVPLIGPVTYVGTEGLGAYLIRTRSGAILIDATMAQNVPAIERNIRTLGVPLRDVKLILVSHAHFDHAAGLAAMRRDTGAKVIAGEGDVEALRTGTPPGETDYGIVRFPPVPVSRGVRNGDTVTLGDVTLRAVATPGHTPGCTTWTMRVTERGRPLNIVFPCSVSVAGNRLIGNRRYPGIVADYRASFERLAALPADVALPMHPEGADVFGRARNGTLVAPGLLRTMTATAREDFEREWRKQGRIAER